MQKFIGLRNSFCFKFIQNFSQKRQFLLNEATNDLKIPCPITKISQVSHDTYIFTLGLEHQEQQLGIPVGNHLWIHGTQVSRKYTPISPIDQKGTCDLLIKIYRPTAQNKEGGLLTQELEHLKVGDNIVISGPIGRFHYQGDGKVKRKSADQFITQKYDNILMCAGGTGITPMYQIIQYVVANELSSQLQLFLLYANKSESDILLRKELISLKERYNNFHLEFCVDKSENPVWKGQTGYITKQMIENLYKPFNKSSSVLACSCGPQKFNQLAIDYFLQIGVKESDIFKF